MRVTPGFLLLIVSSMLWAKPFKVVLDPGHGGESTGALGIYGMFEKDVTLAVAKRLGRLLSTEPDMTVFYTREDDTTVGLRDRAMFANLVDADVFISIHTNASPSPEVFGIETFYLGKGSDRDAEETARKENDADISNDDETVVNILQDLKNTANIQGAAMLAELIQGHLVQAVPETNNRFIRQARFAVLRAANMPAVVVELGFLTHPEEGLLLLQPRYQERLATALRDAVMEYRARCESAPFERAMRGYWRLGN